jgi:tetratricopeptide (TPR) repeat protein
MSQVAKLKKQAAEFEAKKQFDKAIGIYVRLLEVFDAHPDEVDVGLFNRVGDLLLRQGNVADAVDYYEQGIDRYSETGFFNNAIALCNKVLRHSPGRASIYYKLGRISAKKGFTNEARTNFLEYADRMQKSGKVDEAFRALTEFADLCPDQDEIRLTLAEQLTRAGRKADAVEQLQTLHEKLDAESRLNDARAVVDRMHAIDPAVEPRKSQARRKSSSSELVFIDLDEPSSFSHSIPEGTPLVPPSRPSGLVEIPPDVATPAIGTKAVTPSDGLLTLSSAVDPDVYTFEDASVEPLLGFEPTVVSDDVSPPPPTPNGTLVTGASTFDPALDSRFDSGRFDAVEDPAANAGRSVQDHVEEVEEVEEAVEADEIDEIDEIEAAAPPPALLDAPMDELLGAAAPAQWTTPVEVRPATSPAAATPPSSFALPGQASGADSPPAGTSSFPSPVLSPTLSVPAAPPTLDDFSEPSADEPLIDDVSEEMTAWSELASSGSIDISFGNSPTADSAALDEMEEPGLAVVNDDDDERGGRTPARTGPIPSLPDGIMLADAIEASPRPIDSDDNGAASLDETIDGEPVAFPTPSQTRRSTAVAANAVEALMASVEAAPHDWGLHRDLGEAMLDAGDRAGGIRELEYAMAGAERDGKLELASSIAEEVARIEPESVKHQQKRVEYAFRTNDRARLIEAYLGLANVLLRSEQVEKARTIYQRVIDLAPDEPRARLALGSITPARGPLATSGFTPIAPPTVRRDNVIPTPRRSGPAPVRPPSGSYINLGDVLRHDDVPRDTRMVVPEEEPTGDEQADFADMLRKFKAGIARNVAPEDHQSHYDLAIAYKEMGLVDEAIAEFQKALGGPNNRLPTYEALGQCFLEKEQYKLASSILSRALSERASEDQLVGILYLLGRAAESQGKAEEALAYYQRVFVVDIQFRDIVDRMSEVEQTLR